MRVRIQCVLVVVDSVSGSALRSGSTDICGSLCARDGLSVCTEGSRQLGDACMNYYLDEATDAHCYTVNNSEECMDHIPLSVEAALRVLNRLNDSGVRTLSAMRYYSPVPGRRRRHTEPASSVILERWPGSLWAQDDPGEESTSVTLLGHVISAVGDWFFGTTPVPDDIDWRSVVGPQAQTVFDDDVDVPRFAWERLSALERITLFLQDYRIPLSSHLPVRPDTLPLLEGYTDILHKLRAMPLEALWERIHGAELLELGKSIEESNPHIMEVYVTILMVVSEMQSFDSSEQSSWMDSLVDDVNRKFCRPKKDWIRRMVLDYRRSRLMARPIAQFDQFLYQWGLELAPFAYANKVCVDLVDASDMQLKSVIWMQRVFRKKNLQQREEGNVKMDVPRRPRSELVVTSLNLIASIPPEDLMKTIKVSYESESGLDYGGLLHDWFSEMAHGLVEDGGLLEPCEDGRGNCVTFPDRVENAHMYQAVGRFVGLSVVHGIPLGIRFPRNLWGMYFHLPLTLDDLRSDDPVMYKHLYEILVGKVEDAGNMIFVTREDGSEEPLSEQNKHRLVQQCLTDREDKFRRPNSPAYFFIIGINQVIHPDEIQDLFSVEDINALIEGEPVIDPVDMLQHIVPHELFHDDPNWSTRLEWFRNVVGSMDQPDLIALTQFFTGDSATPVGGFRNLLLPMKLEPDLVIRADVDNRLPSAKTCFNQLFLPFYSSDGAMREMILTAIHSETGFQIC